MAAGTELTPTSYINHHLSHLPAKIGDGGFMTLHVDTVVTSILLGIIGFGLLRWIVAGATAGVPNKRQAFVEMMFDFVDEQVKGVFHGDRHKFVAPLALCVFVWVFLMNSMDFLPVDIMAALYEAIGLHNWRSVPTADVNTTFALALSVWGLMIYFNFAVKGFGGFMHEIFCTPFGGNPLLWIFNLMFNLVELISKPLSHALRLSARC